MLLIESSLGDGKIFFANGVPIHAEIGKWSGVEAFITLLTLKEGRFRLEQKSVPVETNIPRSRGQELLMEGVRLSDEMREAERNVPSREAVLVPGEIPAKPEDEMAGILSTFKGGKTISDAMEEVDFPPYRFFPLLHEAISRGFLLAQTGAGEKRELIRNIRAALERL